MTKEQEIFVEIGKQLTGGEQSQMFGKPCFKINGKAFISFFENEMVFKLTGDAHKEALSRDGAHLFDPSGKGRAMKEWVQVPFSDKKIWKKLATAAFEYVNGA
jgi:hypothetical protein